MKTTGEKRNPRQQITKIYVGNLNYATKEGDLHNLFTKYGKVGKIEVIRDKKTERSTGIAFLQMFNKEHAAESIKKLNGRQMMGRTLKVSVALEREPLKTSPKNDTKKKPGKPEKEIEAKPKKRRRKRPFDFDFSSK